MSNPTIKLQSKDGVVYEVDVEVAKRCQTIKTMLEDMSMDDCDEVIPLPNVSSAILNKMIEWSTHHKDDPPPANAEPSAEKRKVLISEWDADFLKVDNCTLFELIEAANYLEITDLLDAACKTVANMIKDKGLHEIRDMFADVLSKQE